MRSSPLFSGTSIFCALSLFSTTSTAQSVPGASLFTGNGAPGAGPYQLVDGYEPSVFFNKFQFYSSYDPTNGHVQYVNETVAVQNGLARTENNAALISVDTTNLYPNGGPGRPAVRLISDNTYTYGLFIIDLAHMPWGCGTWPAYWLLGPWWPYTGEIDIIEGVNNRMDNTVAMHTSPGCQINGDGQTADFKTSNCDKDANQNSGCGSQLNSTNIPNNYGDGLNKNGGGVYATEWTANYVKTWFFPRGSIPPSITSGAPNVSAFGIPAVNAQSGGGYYCDLEARFTNMSIIINTDFCGDYAGNTYAYETPSCPMTPGADSWQSCVNFVGNNPSNFTEAYWQINSLRVYQMPPGGQPSSSYTTSQATATPSASSNSFNVGMGTSTNTLGSTVYTGPVSSATTSAPAASGTPAICPDYNSSQWTNANNEQYDIGCGYDYNGDSPGFEKPAQAALSFENCMEICDATYNCIAVSYVGGNGAGTCYLKSTDGFFAYDGATNAAIRVNGAAYGSGPPSYATTSSSSSLSVDGGTYQAPSTTYTTVAPYSPPPVASTTSSSSSTASSSSSSVAQTSSSMSSSSSSQMMTSSSSSTQASASPTSNCRNNTLVSNNGRPHTLYCGSDTTQGAYAELNYLTGDYTQCEPYCDLQGCDAWVWAPGTDGGGACYLKHAPVSAVPATAANAAQWVAGVVVQSSVSTSSATISRSGSASSMSTAMPSTSAACPAVNNTQITDVNGKNYTIICSSDTVGGSFATSLFNSGDFTQCMGACDNNTGCIAWTWQPYGPGMGGVCYLKNTDRKAAPGGSALVAGLLVPPTPGAVTRSSSSSSSRASSSSSRPASSSSTSRASSSGAQASSSGVSRSGSTISTRASSSGASPSPSAYTMSSRASASATSPSTVSTRTSSSGMSSSTPTISSQTSSSVASTRASTGSSVPSTTSSSLSSSTAGGPTTSAMSMSSSVSSSSSSLSSSTTSTYNSIPTPACNSSYIDPRNGNVYGVHCRSDNSAPTFMTVPVSSGGFGMCFAACDAQKTCAGFTFIGEDSNNGDSGVCDLKSTTGSYASAGNNVVSCFITFMYGGSPPGGYNTSRLSTSLGSSTTQPITTISTASSASTSSSAPPCPSSTTTICGSTQQTFCSSNNGATYNVTCGFVYTGTILNPATPGYSKRQSTEPTYQACTNLCDATTGCIAFNYVGTSCTLLGSVTGTFSVPGAIAGSQVSPPTTSAGGAPGYSLTASTSIPSAMVTPTTTGESSTSLSSSTYFAYSPSNSMNSIEGLPYASTCKPTPGTGTTTVFTTHTITSCGVPMTCPNSGYGVIGGTAATSSAGSAVTYTVVPMGGSGVGV
ncbi:hypothetical protein LTR56_012516 [Elasticomyces elasticus]|nr:hypothetical protein LTR56_012516 [Elasticomyces elasticus]KAK3666239.1 hypothetical protein LTR22_002903 [Elasticomyces elasticus]KAK4926836.1 hypothetical protein LTR49_006252 [Elasticomyces elasticus]KAK5763671.1 hypothetical protein LTS12_006228 [Elasticomyces elasticus]